MISLQKINEFENTLSNSIQELGVGYVAKEFILLYEQYREIAKIATNNQYKDNWSHSDLIKFLEKGEF
jgi:hypothetical protein